MTPEQRKEMATKGALAKVEMAKMPKVSMKRDDIKIADISIPCAIIEVNGEAVRVLTETGIYNSMFGVRSGGSTRLKKKSIEDGAPLPVFLTSERLKPFIDTDKNASALLSPIKYVDGSRVVTGYDARILPAVCDIWLKAREAGALQKQQLDKAQKAEILMRGLAHVGIIALVDEATGYQKDRAKDALAKILEAFVAKELQPWVKTFPAEYYEQLFRLYSIPFPPEKSNWRPQFFGGITNEVIYKRIAPDLLHELKKAANKSERKVKLHQWLSSEAGHPKLREHLASIITLLKLSDSPKQFRGMVDRIHPRFGDSEQFDF
jgi:hypothetical protein